MTLRLFALASLAVVPLTAQRTVPNPVIGMIQRVDAGTLQLRSGNNLIVFSAHDKLEVWKERTFHDFSALRVGEEVRVTWRSGPGGKLALSVSTVASLSGIIQDIQQDRVEIRDPSSNHTQIVIITPDTNFGSSRGKLEVGNQVHVNGWDLGGGRMEVRRVAVYNTDMPLNPVVR